MDLRSLVPLALASLILTPRVASAESAAATADLWIQLQAPASVASGQEVQLVLRLANEGTFSVQSAVVSIPLPEGLSFVSASASDGTYDSASGAWTTGSVQSFLDSILTITARAEAGWSSVTVIAEVTSAEITWGGYDVDSTPGNGDPCEDDWATVTIAITGDAGTGMTPDAGTCVLPDARPWQPVPDGGAPSDGGESADGGDPGPDGEGCGCASSDPTEGSTLLLIALAILAAMRPRRSAA